jgi:hypothetical protein
MSKHISRISGTTTYVGNCYLPDNAQLGQVWFDSMTQSLQTFDGMSWQSIELNDPIMEYDSEQAVDWAIEKMRQEETISKFAGKYPVVAEALGQLEIALKLCQNLETDEKSK